MYRRQEIWENYSGNLFSMEGQVKNVSIIERIVAFRRLGAYLVNVLVLAFDRIGVLYYFHLRVSVSPR